MEDFEMPFSPGSHEANLLIKFYEARIRACHVNLEMAADELAFRKEQGKIVLLREMIDKLTISASKQYEAEVESRSMTRAELEASPVVPT